MSDAIPTLDRPTDIAPASPDPFPRLLWWLNPQRDFAILYLIALVINLAFGFLHGFRPDPSFLDSDEAEYYKMSTALLTGSLSLSGRRTLGFPLILAAIRSISDNFLFLQAVVATVYSLSAPMLSIVVRRIGGSGGTGFLAGLALAIWPTTIFYGTSLYSETTALPLFLLTLAMLSPGSRITPYFRYGAIGVLLCGIMLGVTTQVRSMYQLFIPFMLLICLVEERRLVLGLQRCALIVAGFLIPILPWSFYVSHVTGTTILVTANGGETLSGGLTPELLKASPDSHTPVHNRDAWVGPGKWLPMHKTGYLTAEELALPYDRRDKILRERTKAWALSHPLDVAYIETVKLTYMWGIYPILRNGMAQALFGNIPVMLLLLLSVTTLIVWRDARLRFARLWLPAIFVSGVALISWGSWRFRQPADATLIGLAAISVTHAVARRRGARNATFVAR